MRSPFKLIVLASLMLALPVHSVDPHTKIHRDTRHGVEFQIPSTWKIKYCRTEPNCIDLGSHVSLSVVDANLENSITFSNNQFERVEGSWIKWGRTTHNPAEVINTRDVKAIYGEGNCLFRDEQGDHTGICIEALLTNGERTAHLDGDAHADKKVFLQIIRTFKFLHRG